MNVTRTTLVEGLSIRRLHRIKVRVHPTSLPQFTLTYSAVIATTPTPAIAAMKFALFTIAAVIGSACAQLSGLSACAINCLATSIPVSGCSLYVPAPARAACFDSDSSCRDVGQH